MTVRMFGPILLALAAAPAAAGLRASYGSNPTAAPLVIEVADNGDARIGEPGEASYGLLIGGTFYVVQTQDGATTVARLADVTAAVDAVVGPIFGDSLSRPGAAQPAAKISSTAKGPKTVAGRPGTLYAIAGLDQNAPARAIDYVFSGDAALKPIGRALENYMNAALVPGAPLLGSGTAELIEETRAIFALGTPLDVGGRFQLQSLEQAAIPAERVRLPARPVTQAELEQAMRDSAKAGKK